MFGCSILLEFTKIVGSIRETLLFYASVFPVPAVGHGVIYGGSLPSMLEVIKLV